MNDEDKTREHLIEELVDLREKIAKLEKPKQPRPVEELGMRAGELLRESGEKCRTLFEESFDGLFITSPAGKILDMNKKGVMMFGYDTKEEVLSLDLEKDVYAYPPDRKRILALVNEQGSAEYEVLVKKKNGEKILTYCSLTAVKDEKGVIASYRGIIRDITEHNRDITERHKVEERQRKEVEWRNLLLWLYEKAPQLPDKELYEFVLERAVQLSESTIGFFHLVSDDQKNVILTMWNSEAVKNCMASFATHYPIDQAGNWVDCVHFKRPIVYNDFPNSPNRKGLPEGHAPVRRFMSVPVVEEDKVRIIFGVGNKSEEYDEHDVMQIQLVANDLQNIIKQRRSEVVLRQSQERLSLALESSRAGTWDRNVVENKSTWDDYHHLLFGLAPGSYSGNPKDFFRMIHPDDRDRVKREMAAALNGDGEYSTTYRVVWPDSSVHFLADRGKVYRDSAGRAVRMIGISWDIAELKQAEEALRESQQQLRNIINFLPDATLVIDKEGKVIAWNRAIEEMTGITAEDMLGKGGYEYALPFYGERRPTLIDLVLQRQEGIEARYSTIERSETVLTGEAYVPGLRGSEAYLFGTASILRDSQGDVVGAIESIRDVTARKRAEEALARAEGKYRGIFENALEGIYQITVEGRFISCNPAFARILGYDSPEELIDTITDISQQLYFNPERRGELLRLIDERGTAKEFEVQFFRKDKTVAWVVLNVRGVRDESGKLAYLEGIAQDVTERRALESQLRQAQKIEAIGTLAGGIAHDFNNILGIIMGYAEIAGLDLSKDSKVKGSINEVVKATHRAKDLVAQILTFSRKSEQERKPLRLTPIVKEAIKLLRASLPTTIEIRQEIDPSRRDDLVLADPTQIHQLLMNLATNAAHAMRENGGVLRITLSPVHFDSPDVGKPMDLSPGKYLNLAVEDTGHGVDRRIIDRIFDPYFTTKGPGEGTGLGLAIVHGIVKSYGGAITVNSEPAKGTAFHVYLPSLEGDGALEKEALTSIPRGNERVLLVDDEEALVNAVKQMLEHLGYKVTAATNSAKALSLFLQRPEQFDLVITDYTMPKMTGTDFAREIMQIRPDVPIVLCTGFNERVSEESVKEMGISALIMKPVSLRGIAELIRKVLKTGDH